MKTQMKLSDAMVLGDTLKTRNVNAFLDNLLVFTARGDVKCFRSGCAIGGAVLAVIDEQLVTPVNVLDWATRLWPWLNQTHVNKISDLYLVGLDAAVAYVRDVEAEAEMHEVVAAAKKPTVAERVSDLILTLRG